ncbi:MAG TPA: 6,7-dimethyl-8-ribityllumazine synthase [Patescibacteria group bacterium]|nr:6,7-dimethyl-8-ribityllumazine synthase [Patescibacteria group bacterium]
MQISNESSQTEVSKEWRIAIIRSKFNHDMTQSLKDKCVSQLLTAGIDQEQVTIIEVPGAFEIPLACKYALDSKQYHCIITLGVVIKGATNHFDMIMNEVSRKIMDLMVEYSIPIIYEVIGCYTKEDAIARTSNDEYNKGTEAAKTAIEMLSL